MRKLFVAVACWLLISPLSAQQLVFPDAPNWNSFSEGDELSFSVLASDSIRPRYSLEGASGYNIQFDSVGHFSWRPPFDFVDRLEKQKEVILIFQAAWPDNRRVRKQVAFTVHHKNRPPSVEDLPVFYVRQATLNTYTISSDYVYDLDGDPITFKSIQSQMPEGSNLTSQGQFTWTPSRSQFASLKNNPVIVEFIVQDQPDKAETRGKLKIAQTQQDLPAEMSIVPSDTIFSIKEDETLNLKIYISDPNGDETIRSSGFISSDKRIQASALNENTPTQLEFTWTPGYSFVDDAQQKLTVEIIFFVLDKSDNRTQRKIKIRVTDTENLIKKDANLFEKYKSNLSNAMLLINQLDALQKKLNDDYKIAKKGKKKRSIVNASLGAVTGFTPLVVNNPSQAKVISGVGGTTVLTFGTLEATEVIGRSKEGILEKIKIDIDIRNKVQAVGDDFARKYALKSARRGTEFDKDIEKLRATLNDQRLVLLELDAYSKNTDKADDKDIKKIFLDYGDDSK